MGIISTIGRRSLKVRLLIYSIYLVLFCGALTMIYPFWLMISGTGKSVVDSSEMSLIPAYLRDDVALYRKAVASLFNEYVTSAQENYNFPISDFKFLEPPREFHPLLVRDWEVFTRSTQLPFYSFFLGHSWSSVSSGTVPQNFREFSHMLYKRFHGNLNELNKTLKTDFNTWSGLFMQESVFNNRRFMPNLDSPYTRVWYDFKENAPYYDRVYVQIAGYFKGSFIYPQYTKDIARYNLTHNTNYSSYDEVRLDSRYPAHKTALERQDWEIFVREVLNVFWIHIDDSAQKEYEAYLKCKYVNSIAKLNHAYHSNYKSFDEVKILDLIPPPYQNLRISDHIDFIKGWADKEHLDPATGKPRVFKVPLSAISIRSVENFFRNYLQDKYRTIAKLNSVYGSNYTDFEQIDPPQYEYHYLNIMARKSELRWEFATRNFKAVISYIMLQGRGLLNTTIYCALAVLCALIFNPLAAYALSRFQLPSTYKILLFLMLTMAFPQMVTQIPNFLMMRELGMLNTFFALILPGLANGYSIFLLKGFFDSLPKELYESAMLDGASEIRIFWQITMSLSKPILAVIALNAFTASYSNFMMALLICQDEKMWTLMPLLYQLQQDSGTAIIYSSLIVASIPTFLIFMFCQNLIMRGIVVPVEK